MSVPLSFAAGALAFALAAVTGALVLRRREWRLTAPLAFRCIMAGALATGTVNHVEDLVLLGPAPLPEQPMAFHVSWTSLTVLDPLAAVLVVARPLPGLVVTAAIIATDVVTNCQAFGRPELFVASNWTLAFQVTFGLFVMLTLPACWRAARRAS